MKHRCPVCGKLVRTSRRARSTLPAFFPFCSKRCKLIDLGAWLDAEYRIPADPREHKPERRGDASADDDHARD